MEPKTLAKIIKIIVNEEVTKIVKKELATMKKQIVAEVKKSIPKQTVIKEQVPQESSSPVDTLEDAVTSALNNERQQSTVESKQFVKDPLLNQILNETAQGYSTQPEEYPTMGGAPATSQTAHGGMSAFRSQMQAQFQQEHGGHGMTTGAQPVTVQEMLPQTDTRGVHTHVSNVPDNLAKALTRDYTDLVKAMNKK